MLSFQGGSNDYTSANAVLFHCMYQHETSPLRNSDISLAFIAFYDGLSAFNYITGFLPTIDRMLAVEDSIS